LARGLLNKNRAIGV